MFLTGSLSFQASQPIRSSDDMSVSVHTIKCVIGKIGDKCSFKRKSNNQENQKSPEKTVNELMESIPTSINHPASEEPVNDASDEDNLVRLFDRFSGMMWPTSDWLEPDSTIVINEASLQGQCHIRSHNSKLDNNGIIGHRGKYIIFFWKSFWLTTSETKIIKSIYT